MRRRRSASATSTAALMACGLLTMTSLLGGVAVQMSLQKRRRKSRRLTATLPPM